MKKEQINPPDMQSFLNNPLFIEKVKEIYHDLDFERKNQLTIEECESMEQKKYVEESEICSQINDLLLKNIEIQYQSTLKNVMETQQIFRQELIAIRDLLKNESLHKLQKIKLEIDQEVDKDKININEEIQLQKEILKIGKRKSHILSDSEKNVKQNFLIIDNIENPEIIKEPRNKKKAILNVNDESIEVEKRKKVIHKKNQEKKEDKPWYEKSLKALKLMK